MTQPPRPASFAGAARYVLDDELAKIVNISIALEMPLLLKGEPGTGKTMLAHAIAETLGMPLIVLNVKSSMKLVEALYQYDTLTRLNDSRFGDSKRDVSHIEDYIRMGKIGQAFTAEARTVLLIDEIDKADTDFQDDMLDVLDQMQFDIIEIDKTVRALHRPVIIITSNAKKDLSDPFLGRCNFHHIAFPGPGHDAPHPRGALPGHRLRPARAAASPPSTGCGSIEGVEKRPATRELINWIRALQSDPDFQPRRSSQGRSALPGGALQKEPGLPARPRGRVPSALTTKRPDTRPQTPNTKYQTLNPLFVDFFYSLRDQGLPVSPTAFLTLHRALAAGLVGSLEDFYTAARAILVKSERYFDLFDQVFAHHFKGADLPDPGGLELDALARAMLEMWLQNPAELARLLGIDERTLARPHPGAAARLLQGAPQGPERGAPRRSEMDRHRRALAGRPLRPPPAGHARGRRLPEQVGGEGRPGAPLPGLLPGRARSPRRSWARR